MTRLKIFKGPSDFYNDRERVLERFDPAWAKVALSLRGGNRYGNTPDYVDGGHRLQDLVKVRETLELWRRRFQAGDTLAILHAIHTCAAENVPIPAWLAVAYGDAFQSFLKPGGPASLSDVFHSPNLPNSTQTKAAIARDDWQLAGEILVAVWDAARQDEGLHSLDETLDRVLSENAFGVAKTKARRLFNMAEKNQIEHLRARGSNIQPLSRIFAKRRKGVTR